jgi:hypothetical protein
MDSTKSAEKVHGIQKIRGEGPWNPQNPRRRSMDSKKSAEKVHGIHKIRGEGPWSPWNPWRRSRDSMESAEKLHERFVAPRAAAVARQRPPQQPRQRHRAAAAPFPVAAQAQQAVLTLGQQVARTLARQERAVPSLGRHGSRQQRVERRVQPFPPPAPRRSQSQQRMSGGRLGLRRLESLSEYSSGDEATGSDDGTINEDRSSSDDNTSGDERTSNSSGSEFMADQHEGTTQLQMRTTTKANPLAMNGMERETEDSESIASEPSDSAAVWDTESVTQDRNIDPPTPPPQPADATIADGSFWPSDDSCGDFENHDHQEDGGPLDFDE